MMFRILTFQDYSFYHCCFDLSCPVLMNHNAETTWLVSQLPPLSCYCADLSQLSCSLCGGDYISWFLGLSKVCGLSWLMATKFQNSLSVPSSRVNWRWNWQRNVISQPTPHTIGKPKINKYNMDHSESLKTWLRAITYMLYVLRHSINHLMYCMLPKSICSLLKINFVFYAFWGYVVFLLPKFMETNRHLNRRLCRSHHQSSHFREMIDL
jgi:hypothetical protein